MTRKVVLLTKSIQKARMTASATLTNQLTSRIAAIAVTLMFVVNGAVIGGFGGSLPSLRDKLGLDATQIAIMLFCGGAAAILAMQIGGRLADAIGAREITLAALPFLIAGMITIGLAPVFGVAIVGAILIGLGNGAMDVAMNAIGVQVEAARQRPIMSFFHAFWSIGQFVGAGATLLLALLLGLEGGAIVTPLSILIAVLALVGLGILFKITPKAAVVPHTIDGVKTPITRAAWILGVMLSAWSASSTVVAVVQTVCLAPSMVKVTWRPNLIAIRVPSWTFVVMLGATTSWLSTWMPLFSSNAPTVFAVVLTSVVCPSIESVTSLLRLA